MNRDFAYLSGEGAPLKVTGWLTVIIGVLLVADVFTNWNDSTERLVMAILAVVAFMFAALQLVAGHIVEQPGFQKRYEEAIKHRQQSKEVLSNDEDR